MAKTLRFSAIISTACLAITCTSFVAHAQPAALGSGVRSLITKVIDERQLVRLQGNTREEASAENDRGRVPDSLSLEHLQLQLRRSPEQEQALQEWVDALHDPKSANYHHWMSAADFGKKFGVAQADRNTISSWLESQGFIVNTVYPNGMLIDFSGTAGQVRSAFHTELHQFKVGDVLHLANNTDPQIPQALAAVVAGVVALHDFKPRPLLKPHADYTYTADGSTYQAVVPSDLATIYDFNPLFRNGNSGQGQTIAVIEPTNVYTSSDWIAFRKTLGLSGYTAGSFTTVHPASAGTNNCTDPGVPAGGADGEAILDAEWASAAAPSAAIVLASCADSRTTFGGLIAMQNLLNGSSMPPPVMSISYGGCEQQTGAAGSASIIALYQQAAAEGVSVFVASGDEGAAGCDANAAKATHGIAVNALASTPYNVAVGGTDFGDAVAGTTRSYWNATNNASYGSAKSYIPEVPWNDSCASTLIAGLLGYATTYGSGGFCNSTAGKADFLTTGAGSGGPSNCATGGKLLFLSTCKGTPKPSWQAGLVGVPNDGVRDLPDVSLFAANGVFGHYYVFCWSNLSAGGAACTGVPATWSGAGGTSFSAPIMAGIQALVNQSTHARQGNPNYVYYKLAGKEYGTGGSAPCNSSKGNAASASCTFYDVTLGDIDVNCSGQQDCYRPSGTNGVLSTSNTAYNKAFGATTGWDFATGIGTVNATNLVNNWKTVSP